MDPPEQTFTALPYSPAAPRPGLGLSLLGPHTPKREVLLSRNSEYGLGTPIQARHVCSCGLDKELQRCKQENEALRTELYAYERTFTERLSKELRRKETELVAVYDLKLQSAESAIRKQVSGELQQSQTSSEDQTKQQYRIYEKYIENLENSKEATLEELERLKKDNQRLQKVELRVRALQA